MLPPLTLQPIGIVHSRFQQRLEAPRQPSAAEGELGTIELFAASGPALKTKRVLVVLFAGGVRSRDTIGTPANVPNLMRLAKQGLVFPNCGVANLGRYGASLSILTGDNVITYTRPRPSHERSWIPAVGRDTRGRRLRGVMVSERSRES